MKIKEAEELWEHCYNDDNNCDKCPIAPCDYLKCTTKLNSAACIIIKEERKEIIDLSDKLALATTACEKVISERNEAQSNELVMAQIIVQNCHNCKYRQTYGDPVCNGCPTMVGFLKAKTIIKDYKKESE